MSLSRVRVFRHPFYATRILRLSTMGWLSFDLPLHEELEVEKAVRQIQQCSDVERLRQIAADAYRAWVTQSDIAAQLISQLADAEAMLASAGVIDPPDEKYLQWASELCPDHGEK